MNGLFASGTRQVCEQLAMINNRNGTNNIFTFPPSDLNVLFSIILRNMLLLINIFKCNKKLYKVQTRFINSMSSQKPFANPLMLVLAIIMLALIAPSSLAFNLSDDFAVDSLGDYTTSGAQWVSAFNVTTLSSGSPFNSSHVLYNLENITASTNISAIFSYVEAIGGDNFVGGVAKAESTIVSSETRTSGYGCAIRQLTGSYSIDTVNLILALGNSVPLGEVAEGNKYKMVMQWQPAGANEIKCKIWKFDDPEPPTWNLTITGFAPPFVAGEKFGFVNDGGSDIHLHFIGYNLSSFPENISCTPDWTCNGYDAGTCLINDTNTAMCNSVTDANVCGENYTGDFTEFDNQTSACDFCTPNFLCDGYSDTCIGDELACNSVNDPNLCFSTTNLSSDDYNGTFTEFTPLTCRISEEDNQAISGMLGLLLALIVFGGLLMPKASASAKETGRAFGSKTVAIVATALLVVTILFVLL